MVGSLQLIQPATVAEASAALAELGESAKIYAGGAELLLLLRHGLLRAEWLIDVKKIARLNAIRWDGKILTVGACVTHHRLESDAAIRERAPAFARAEAQVANIRVRNQGTLGGNLCFNDPHSDPATVLLIYGATVVLGDQRGERPLGIDEFLLDMYSTALKPHELLLEVQIPPLPDGMYSGYVRLHRYQRPTLGVAAAVRTENGTIAEARLAAGCIGPKAQRLSELEVKIAGMSVKEAGAFLRQQKSYLSGVLRPVDDLLGSAEYKLYMAGILLSEALEAVARDGGLKSEEDVRR
jgi:carbon-monoxide dehydrogenase medium subunit